METSERGMTVQSAPMIEEATMGNENGVVWWTRAVLSSGQKNAYILSNQKVLESHHKNGPSAPS